MEMQMDDDHYQLAKKIAAIVPDNTTVATVCSACGIVLTSALETYPKAQQPMMVAAFLITMSLDMEIPLQEILDSLQAADNGLRAIREAVSN